MTKLLRYQKSSIVEYGHEILQITQGYFESINAMLNGVALMKI